MENNQWGGCHLDHKKSRRELLKRIFALGIFWGGVGWSAIQPLHWLLLCLRFIVIQPVFVHGYQSRQGIIWIAPKKKSKCCSDDWHRWRFWFAFRHSGPTSRRTSACPNLREWWTQPAHVRRPVSQLLIWPKSGDLPRWVCWFWSVISGVITVLDRLGRGASQVEKSPRLNWTTLFLTVAYNGVGYPNVSVRMAWISFDALLAWGKNLMTARVSMMLKSRASPDMLRFGLGNKKNLQFGTWMEPLQRHYRFRPTTLLSMLG